MEITKCLDCGQRAETLSDDFYNKFVVMSPPEGTQGLHCVHCGSDAVVERKI